jgi:thiol-disulfide isomerase/thioredoxin
MKDKKRIFALVAVVIIVVLAIFYLETQKARPSSSSKNIEGDSSLAPDFQGIDTWLNSEALSLEDLRGKVVLVDFWTYSCINCIRTQPYLNAWHEKYSDKGLVIIGVHTPEFEFEKDPENVKNAIEENGIEYAVALDNDYTTWRAYKNRYWPRKYLVDKEGIIRYDHIGEGAYEETEKMIQKLLAETGSKVDDSVVDIKSDKSNLPKTKELYAGYGFAFSRDQDLGNKQGLKPGETIDYTIEKDYSDLEKEDTIYLQGEWMSGKDDLLAVSNGKIVLDYTASEINIVAQSKEKVTVKVINNGEEKTLDVFKPSLYNLYKGEHGNHLIEIIVPKGFSFNSFTFG